MALQKTVIPAVLQKGLATGRDPKVAMDGLLKLENAVMDYGGQVRKRWGLKNLTGTIAAGSLATYKDRCVTLGASVGIHDGASADSEGFDAVAGQADSADVEVRPWAGIVNAWAQCAEVQTVGDIVAVVREQVDNSDPALTRTWYLETYDRYSGVLIDTASSPYQIRVVSLGGVLYYFTPSGAAAAIHYSSIDSAGAIGTSMAVPTGMLATWTAAIGWQAFDVCEIDEATGDAILIHQTAAGGVQYLCWETPSLGGGIWTQASVPGITTPGPMSCCKMTDGTGVIFYTDDGAAPRVVGAEGRRADGTLAVSATLIYSDATTESIQSVTGYANSPTEVQVYIGTYSPTSVANGAKTHINTFINTAGTGSTGAVATAVPVFRLGLTPVSKPWLTTGGHCMLMYYTTLFPTDTNATCYVVNQSGVLMARSLSGYARWTTIVVGAVAPLSVDLCMATAVEVLREGGDPHRQNAQTARVDLLEVDTRTASIRAVEGPEALHIAGGIPRSLDGQRCVEHGFHQYPHGLTTDPPSAGGSMAAGVYSWKLIYEWINDQGQICRSAPSPSSSQTIIALSGNYTVGVNLPNLALTEKSGVSIVVYRTEADGAIYYRNEALTRANDATARSQSVSDTYVDSSLGEEEEYTRDGRIADNTPPPPHRASCMHQGRHVVVNRERESWDVRYSKPFVTGDGLEHCDFLTLECSPEGGRITALASYKDRLIMFKEGMIFGSAGNGRDNAASGQGYSTPRKISSAVGCINQKSVIETPDGLLFADTSGIWALGPTFQVQYLGEPVKYYTDTYTITGAALIRGLDCAVWTTSAGPSLVYNYRHGQWMTWSNYAAADCTAAQGRLYHKSSPSTVKVEDRAGYLDDGDGVSLTVRTGWFSFAKLLGFARLYRLFLLGQNRSHHRLQVRIAFNHETDANGPIWRDTLVFDSADVANYHDLSGHYGDAGSSVNAGLQYLLRAAPSLQKVTSVMLEISDLDRADAASWADLFDDAAIPPEWATVEDQGTVSETGGDLVCEAAGAELGFPMWQSGVLTPVAAHHTFEDMGLSGAGLYLVEAPLTLSTTGAYCDHGVGLFTDLNNAYCAEVGSDAAPGLSQPRCRSIVGGAFTETARDGGAATTTPVLRIYWNNTANAAEVVNGDMLTAAHVRGYVSRDGGTTWTAIAASQLLTITPTGIVLYSRTHQPSAAIETQFASVTVSIGVQPSEAAYSLAGLAFELGLKRGPWRIRQGRAPA